MAIELIERKLCDGHLVAMQEEVPGFTTNPTRVNGKLMVMELCNNCEETMTVKVFMEYLTNWGREHKPAKGKSKAQTDMPADVPCSFCPRQFTSNQGRIMHERRSHADLFAAREAEQLAEAAAKALEEQPELPVGTEPDDGPTGTYDIDLGYDVIEPGEINEPVEPDVIFKGRRGECPDDECKRKFKTYAGWTKHIGNMHPDLAKQLESGELAPF